MGDHTKWDKLNTTISAESDNIGGDWKTIDDAELASIVDLSALSAGDQTTLKALWHRWRRMPWTTQLTASEYSTFATLFADAEP